MTTLTGPRAGQGAVPRPASSSAPRAQATLIQGLDPFLVLRKYKLVLVLSAVIGALVGTIGHFGLKVLYPTFVSRAVFECRPPTQDVGTTADRVDAEELNLFMANQVATIMSDHVLTRAVNRPAFINDAKKWWRNFGAVYDNGVFNPTASGALDKPKAVEYLKDNLKVRVNSGTSYIEMSMGWRSATDATAIVTHVRKAYEEILDEAVNAEFQRDRTTLDLTRKALENQLDELQLQSKNKVTNLGADSLDVRISESRSMLDSINGTLTTSLAERSALQSQFDTVSQAARAGLVTEEIRSGVEQDPAIRSLKTEINAAEAARNALLEQVTPEHRDVRIADARISGLKRRLDEERQTLQRQFMEATLDSLRRGIDTAIRTEGELNTKRLELSDRLTQLTVLETELMGIQRLQEAASERLDETVQTLQSLADRRASYPVRVVVAQMEQKPTDVAFPKIYIMIPAGIVSLLAMTAGVVFLRELVDQRVKGPADLAALPRGRMLGIMPHGDESPDKIVNVETVFRDLPRSVLAESFRQLRAVLQQRATSGGPCSILCAGCMPGSGATTIVSNLALAFAAADAKVLVIDANSRRPRLHTVFGLQVKPGLGECLAGAAKLEECVNAVAGSDVLHVLCTGSNEQHQLERITTDRMSDLLALAKQKYDIILIDVAPAVVSGDARALAGRCDYALLVTRAFAEKRGMVSRLFGELSEQRAELLGVIVNAMRSTTGGYLKTNIRATHDYHNAED